MFMCNARRTHTYLRTLFVYVCVCMLSEPYKRQNCEKGYTKCSLYAILPFNVRYITYTTYIYTSFDFRSYFCAHIKCVGRFGTRWIAYTICMCLWRGSLILYYYIHPYPYAYIIVKLISYINFIARSYYPNLKYIILTSKNEQRLNVVYNRKENSADSKIVSFHVQIWAGTIIIYMCFEIKVLPDWVRKFILWWTVGARSNQYLNIKKQKKCNKTT